MDTLDGIVSDHNELMRNHFSGALNRAQEVDEAPIEEAELGDAAKDILSAAKMIEAMSSEEGREVFDESIPAVLRDIAKDVEDYRKASQYPLLQDDQKKRLRKRYLDSVKDGAIFLGRFSFFFTVFLIAPPSMAALGAVGSLASILGLAEQAKPGTLYSIYSKFRKALPLLPEIPKPK